MEVVFRRLGNGEELDPREIRHAAELLLDGSVSDGKKELLLLALSKKGETPAEIAGFVEVFLEHAIDPGIGDLELGGPTLDVCGTGGDQLDLFNVSTTAMFIAAAAGAIVVKHGNRGITSKSGGADVLEALGVRIDLPPDGLRRCLGEAGVGFLFAPKYHPAFRAVAGVRKKLAADGHRSIFNLIGPLLNPARPECQLVGVAEGSLCPTFVEILTRLGRKSAWVVSGSAAGNRGVDEISLMGQTRICKGGMGREYEETLIQPEDFGMESCSVEELQGGDARENAVILEAILAGKDRGVKTEIVLLNAAAALACAGLAEGMDDGLEIARGTLESGAALQRLRALQAVCRG